MLNVSQAHHNQELHTFFTPNPMLTYFLSTGTQADEQQGGLFFH